MISIGVEPSRPLTTLSLAMFSTILILANTFWNKPFKIYGKIIAALELIYGVVLILLQINTVLLTQISKNLWEILGCAITAFLITLFGLGLWISVRETIKTIKINCKKLTKKSGNEGREYEQEDEQSKESSDPSSINGSCKISEKEDFKSQQIGINFEQKESA